MVKYKKEFSNLFKEAQKEKITKIPKNKVRRLSYYLRNVKGYKIAKTRKGDSFLILM